MLVGRKLHGSFLVGPKSGWNRVMNLCLFSFSSRKGVWSECFLFLFLLKTKNDDENIFDWIFENIFSTNENKKYETTRK